MEFLIYLKKSCSYIRVHGYGAFLSKVAEKVRLSRLRRLNARQRPACKEGLYAPLFFKADETPGVSIIIPVYNKFEYTYACLESILLNTDEGYEVIVVDNASADGTREIESIAKNIRVLRNKTNLGFVEASNAGARAARGSKLLFLNNDTVVHKGWLGRMVETMERDGKTGAVGPKLVYPDGTLQEAGGIAWNAEAHMVSSHGRLKAPDDYEYNYLKEVDYCSGACLLVRKELFEKLGGFDTRYAPAYCEDVDLAFGLRALGYRVVYQPLATVTHCEGMTGGSDRSAAVSGYQLINQRKLHEKWKDTLKENHFRQGENLFLARDRPRSKSVLAVIGRSTPAEGSSLFMRLVELAKAGFKVIFIPDDLRKAEPQTTLLQQLGVEAVYGKFDFADWIKKNGRYLDWVWLSPEVSDGYKDLLRTNTPAKILSCEKELHGLEEKAFGTGAAHAP